MATATNIQVTDFHNGTRYVSWTAANGGHTLAAGYGYNYNGNPQNWVTEIQFTLTAACTKLYFSFFSKTQRSTPAGPLRYKIITTKDSSTYTNATSATTGQDGTFTMSEYDYTETTFNLTKTLSAGTYYMYIWTSKATSTACFSEFNSYSNYPISITYDASASTNAVYIGNGSTWDAYAVYIGNGSGWDQYKAYYGSGSAWVECG